MVKSLSSLSFLDSHGTAKIKFALKLAAPPPTFQLVPVAPLALGIPMTLSMASAINVLQFNTTMQPSVLAIHAQTHLLAALITTEFCKSAVALQDILLTR